MAEKSASIVSRKARRLTHYFVHHRECVKKIGLYDRRSLPDIRFAMGMLRMRK